MTLRNYSTSETAMLLFEITFMMKDSPGIKKSELPMTYIIRLEHNRICKNYLLLPASQRPIHK